jgi:hypothetical protein
MDGDSSTPGVDEKVSRRVTGTNRIMIRASTVPAILDTKIRIARRWGSDLRPEGAAARVEVPR